MFPFTQRISKFSCSISEGNQESSSDQLLGQFPQNVSFSSCKDSRHFVFRHLSVSADQYQRGALLAAKQNVSGVSIAKNVIPLWENSVEKWCWKPDYELHPGKMDSEVACAVI